MKYVALQLEDGILGLHRNISNQPTNMMGHREGTLPMRLLKFLRRKSQDIHVTEMIIIICWGKLINVIQMRETSISKILRCQAFHSLYCDKITELAFKIIMQIWLNWLEGAPIPYPNSFINNNSWSGKGFCTSCINQN